jgi:hypothetical protein
LFVNGRSRDSSVSIVTRLRAGRLGFNSRQWKWWIFFLFATASRSTAGRTQPLIQWGSGARETDHSPPWSAEVKNEWSYASTPQYVFMEWCLVKHRDNFIFTVGMEKTCIQEVFISNLGRSTSYHDWNFPCSHQSNAGILTSNRPRLPTPNSYSHFTIIYLFNSILYRLLICSWIAFLYNLKPILLTPLLVCS